MLENLFGRNKSFDDATKSKFIDRMAVMLKIQIRVGAPGASIEDEQGDPKRKALGYIYGYIDAALRMMGHDMADMSIGPPITYHVIRKLWPGHVNEYMDVLVRNLHSDPLMSIGIMHGGQKYLDHTSKPGMLMPMGLARFMLDAD